MNLKINTLFILLIFSNVLLSKNKFVLDIRTGAINKSIIERFKFNMGMKLESFLFDHISIILYFSLINISPILNLPHITDILSKVL